MKYEEFRFGTTRNGEAVSGFEVTNSNGVSIKVVNHGATLVSVKTPDRNGKREEITLGFSRFGDYEEHSPYFGSTIGRVANRIREGRFSCDGSEFQLARNEDGHTHLHGGNRGFDKVLWELEPKPEKDRVLLVCRYCSPDGEEGYPGTLQVIVSYTLDESDNLTIDYIAETDRICPVNLTNHTYWNLCGNKRDTILGHFLQLTSDAFLPVDDRLLPSGEIKPVTGTAWDFRRPRRIGEQIAEAGGYDHCFVLSMSREVCRPVASLYDPVSGRAMEVSTTEPGIQLYSGNFLDRLSGFGFKKHDGLCLEAQLFPDAVNRDFFPTVLLRPGEKYTQRTRHRFMVRD